MRNDTIPANEKYALTVQEASKYYSIGVKRLRQICEEHLGELAVFHGNKYLVSAQQTGRR